VSCRDSTASTLFTKPDDTQCKVNALPLKIGAGRGSFGEGLKTGVAENWINLLPSSSNAHNFLLLAFLFVSLRYCRLSVIVTLCKAISN
jgi:hypothetical protein